MPNAMKIQPLDSIDSKLDQVTKPVFFKSRFRRLFDRQLRTPAAQPVKPALTGEEKKSGSDTEFEPSSVCLTNMVQNYIEENNNEKQKCGKNSCNCFNGAASDDSDDEWEFPGSYTNSADSACDTLKSLVLCASVLERNILADAAKMVEKNKRRDAVCRKTVVDGLLANGYDASVCKSKWEKSPTLPAGVYEYVAVIAGTERLIIDLDFRCQFEVARATKAYKSILQTLPNIFVGRSDRLEKIVDIVCEAARQSLKKRGMPIAPWRKTEYVKSKWLSPENNPPPNTNNQQRFEAVIIGKPRGSIWNIVSPNGELEIVDNTEKTQKDCWVREKRISRDGGEVFDHKVGDAADGDCEGGVFVLSNRTNSPCEGEEDGDVMKKKSVTAAADDESMAVKKWEPPEVIIRPKSMQQKGVKLVTGGLASLIQDNNNDKSNP